MQKRNFKGKINVVVIINFADDEIIILNLYFLRNFELVMIDNYFASKILLLLL